MVMQSKTPPASGRVPRRVLGIAVAFLSAAGLLIILLFPSLAPAAIAIPVLTAFSIIGLYSAWQLLRRDSARPRYIMRTGKAYPAALTVFGVVGLIYAVIVSVNSSSPTMIGIYLIVLATGLRGLYGTAASLGG